MSRAASCCVLLLFIVGPALAQESSSQSRTRFLRWAYQDAAGLAQTANARTPLYAMGVVAVLSPLSTFDAQIDHRVRQPRGAFGRYLTLTNELGGPRMNLPVVGVFAVSLLTDSPRFQDAAFTSLQSMLYAGALSYGLKYTAGRLRPSEHDGPYGFQPFSGSTSFPSGHTTTVFAVLTPWVLYYPHPVTFGLYALATTGTAFSRIVREKHWTTDVLAGGTLGFMTAYWLTRRHQDDTPRLTLTPVISYNAVSVTLQFRL